MSSAASSSSGGGAFLSGPVVPQEAAAILDFWFLPQDDPKHGQTRAEWFKKDAVFDERIRTQFGGLIERALSGEQQCWPEAAKDPRVAVAWIILLDQFTRNSFRGSGKSFAGDPQALAATKALLAADNGAQYKSLSLPYQSFALMPLMHSEALADQEECVARFAQMSRDFADSPAEKATSDSQHGFAIRHFDIIKRFGRFPHRNALLGRNSTEEEKQFLTQPGSSF